MRVFGGLRWLVMPLVFLAVPDVAATGPAAPAGEWGRVVTGHLRNGVRFAILPRHSREPGVGLLMRNEGGFIAERRPGERGLAHLIEHIVFHSPTTRAPEDRDHLPRLGLPLTFPAPNAGSTSWRETNYYLSTRTATPGDLDTLLGLFREAAAEMTLRADAVDMARSEVVREMADKKAGNDIYADYIASIAPGSPNDVIDGQNSADVPGASIATIRDLYHRLYRPEAMMIVVVGNVRPEAVKALIEKRFGDWQAAPAPRRAAIPVFQPDRVRPVSFSARPQGRRTALTTVVLPTPAPPATRDAQARATLMDLLVTRAVGDRLAASQPTEAPGKTGIFIENGEQGHRQIMLWDNFAPGQWQPAVAGLWRTRCTLDADGFTKAEWAAAKRNLLADLGRRVAAMAQVPNVDLARDLSHAMADGQRLIPPDELLARAQVVLPRLDARAASRWWRAQWRGGARHLRVEAPEMAGVADPVAAIRAAAVEGTGTSGCALRP